MKRSGFIPIVVLFFLVLSFFLPSLVRGTLPIPSDTIVGLYHPYRDAYARDFPNGIPYKNALITDPVRQQYPWKSLAITEWKKGAVPTWNPYTFSGTPLLANFQSAVFYPLNVLFFLLPFTIAWNWFIILQQVLGSIFLYLYLKNLRLSVLASLFGGFTFAFSGFVIAWLTWGNIIHTALWLPLVLLSVDKVFASLRDEGNAKFKSQSSKLSIRRAQDPELTEGQFKIQQSYLWLAVFTLAFVSSFLAGHLQTFFYVFLMTSAYVFFRWFHAERRVHTLFLFALCSLLFALLTFVQWYPTWQFIAESARSVDQANWHRDGWFIPWQHAIQFIVPDFFGNPTTLNYFGVWNYGEFIGYIGLLPMILAFFVVLFKREKTVHFFLGVIVVALLFAFPTFIAALPYRLSLPFLSTAQPTRLLVLIDFALAVLAAIGLDVLLKEKKKFLYPLGIVIALFVLLWGIILLSPELISSVPENTAVTKRNLQLPTLLLVGITVIYGIFLKMTNKRLLFILLVGLFALSVADISRFAAKFTPFTNTEYLYPQTKTLSFLQNNIGHYRYMTTDSRILPPNFSMMYGLQTIEGYDPLYLRRYGEFIAAMERGRPDISSPLGFNRIITPHDLRSPYVDFLGVKYILSLSELQDPTVRKVFQEGETRVYENSEVLPRVFFVQEITPVADNKQQEIMVLSSLQNKLDQHAVVGVNAVEADMKRTYASGSAEILSYAPNTVRIRTRTDGDAFLVLTDSYYPTWSARILRSDTSVMQESKIYRTNYAFRGITVPAGEYIVEFSNTLL